MRKTRRMCKTKRRHHKIWTRKRGGDNYSNTIKIVENGKSTENQLRQLQQMAAYESAMNHVPINNNNNKNVVRPKTIRVPIQIHGGVVPSISSNVISIPEIIRQISEVEEKLALIKNAPSNPSSLAFGSIENQQIQTRMLEQKLAKLNQKKRIAYNDLILAKDRLDLYSDFGRESKNVLSIQAQINALETDINWEGIETRVPRRGNFTYENYPANILNATRKATLDAAKERLQYEIARQKANRNKRESTTYNEPYSPIIDENYVKPPNVNRNGTRHLRLMLPASNSTLRLTKARRNAATWLANHSP
jgi:hypothetical protein